MPGLEGTTLGRYRLVRRLGKGGMSEVYLARDRREGRQVAVKVVSGVHAEYLERFRREAEAILNLRHRHILPAYEYGEQEPWYYLAMYYASYGALSKRLSAPTVDRRTGRIGRGNKRQGGPLRLEEAAVLLEQIASALQYAHDSGIIHRDIKPSNILLRGPRYAYLADFGLAKALEGAQGLTQTGSLLGTPEYMAPELSLEPASTSSDIYALGILLYQMVAGLCLSPPKRPSPPSGNTCANARCRLHTSTPPFRDPLTWSSCTRWKRTPGAASTRRWPSPTLTVGRCVPHRPRATIRGKQERRRNLPSRSISHHSLPLCRSSTRRLPEPDSPRTRSSKKRYWFCLRSLPSPPIRLDRPNRCRKITRMIQHILSRLPRRYRWKGE